MTLFYEPDTDSYFADFAEDVVYAAAGKLPQDGVTIKGIFDNGFRVVNGMESYGPQLTVKTSDVAGAKQDGTVTVQGTTYKIIGNQPDGTGITILILSKD